MRNRKQLKSVLAGVGIASSIAVGNAQSATVPTGGLLLSLRADTHLSISGQTWGDENGGTNRVDTFVGTTPTLSSVTTPNGPHAAINFGGSTEITLNDGNTGGTATGVTTPALNVQNITAYVVGNLTTTQFSEIFLDDFSHNNGWAVGVTDSGNGSANATKWY